MTLVAVFCAGYGVCRFLSDFLRVNDETLAGLTGAQYLSGAMVLASLWMWFWVRPNIPDASDLVEAPEEGQGDKIDADDAVEDEQEADAEP